MSKHGNNNARHVLIAEGKNLQYYAINLFSYVDRMKKTPTVNILDEKGQETVSEVFRMLEQTISELKTILPS